MSSTPDPTEKREKGPLTIAEGVRAAEIKRQREEREREISRDREQEAEKAAAWKLAIDNLKDTNKSQRLQLRIAAAVIIFLVGAIVFRELGFSVGADGLKLDGSGGEATEEKP